MKIFSMCLYICVYLCVNIFINVCMRVCVYVCVGVCVDGGKNKFVCSVTQISFEKCFSCLI